MVGGFTCWHYFSFHAFIPSLIFIFSTFFSYISAIVIYVLGGVIQVMDAIDF
jgi:hypothetical protein